MNKMKDGQTKSRSLCAITQEEASFQAKIQILPKGDKVTHFQYKLSSSNSEIMTKTKKKGGSW